jgi:hypothetical protein
VESEPTIKACSFPPSKNTGAGKLTLVGTDASSETLIWSG